MCLPKLRSRSNRRTRLRKNRRDRRKRLMRSRLWPWIPVGMLSLPLLDSLVLLGFGLLVDIELSFGPGWASSIASLCWTPDSLKHVVESLKLEIHDFMNNKMNNITTM